MVLKFFRFLITTNTTGKHNIVKKITFFQDFFLFKFLLLDLQQFQRDINILNLAKPMRVTGSQGYILQKFNVTTQFKTC